MIINQKTFLKNDKNPETEANPIPKNWNRGKHLANPQAITKTQFLKTETKANPEAQTSNTNTFTKQIYIYIN